MSSGRAPSRGLWLAIPLLLIATGSAVISVGFGLGRGEAIVAAVAGAWTGVLVGTGLGISRVRLAVVLTALAAFAALGWAALDAALASELVPRSLGPGRTLAMTSAARFGVTAFVTVALLRALAARLPALRALELLGLAFAMAAAFVAHRDGVIARPLWLADWAWRTGIDPSRVLLAIGLAVVVVLGALLVAQRSEGRGFSALALLLLLGLASTLTVHVAGPPRPEPLNDLGLADDRVGEPPRPPPIGPVFDAAAGPSDPASPDSGLEAGADAASEAGPATSDAGKADSGDSGGSSAQRPQPPERPDSDSPPTSRPRPVGVVILDNDYSPPSEAYYFRQEVLSQYNGARLVKTSRADADRDVLASFPASTTLVAGAPGAAGRKLVRARVALLVDHPQPFALETPREVAPLANPNPTTFVRAYRFEALAQAEPYEQLARRGAGDPRWSAELGNTTSIRHLTRATQSSPTRSSRPSRRRSARTPSRARSP